MSASIKTNQPTKKDKHFKLGFVNSILRHIQIKKNQQETSAGEYAPAADFEKLSEKKKKDKNEYQFEEQNVLDHIQFATSDSKRQSLITFNLKDSSLGLGTTDSDTKALKESKTSFGLNTSSIFSSIDNLAKSIDWGGYFHQQLKGVTEEANAITEFPFDFEAQTKADVSSKNDRDILSVNVQLKKEIPEYIFTNVKQLCEKENVSELTILATVFSLLIGKHCHTKEVVVGLMVEDMEVTLPLRNKFNSGIDDKENNHADINNNNNNHTKLNSATAEQLYLLNKTEKLLNFIKRASRKYGAGQQSSKVHKALIKEEEFFNLNSFSKIMVSNIPISELKENVQLALSFSCDNGGIIDYTKLCWSYNPLCFNKDTIPRLHERFITILSSFVKAKGLQRFPKSTLWDTVEVIPACENNLLRQYCVGSTRPISNKVNGLYELVEMQVARVPTKVAVVDKNIEDTLTYEQLNGLSNGLALFILGWNNIYKDSQKVQQRVAVMMPRCRHTFICLLAVLKAGAAYVPIDPTYPSSRIEHILEDSECNIILTTSEVKELVPEQFRNRVINLPDDPLTLPTRTVNINKVVKQSDLFVILYTSGTTGKPKGVAIENFNALIFLENYLWDPVTENDTWAQMANHAFIGSMNDVWLPLTRGATTSIIPKEKMMDPTDFEAEIKLRGITCTFMTPKMLEIFADSDTAIFDGLNVVQVAGEAVRMDAVIKLAGKAKHLQNLYGCTERTGCISGYEVPCEGLPESLKNNPRLPIGLPIENTQMYILDKDMQPVPIGVVGDLYIGGPQITRGYLNRDDLTLEKFITNPFDGGRMYKTGDTARWLADGHGVDLMGRSDSMVKIRGFRVELGEIETAIMKAGCEVASSAVVLHDQDQLQKLTAYVTSTHIDIDLHKLLEKLKQTLPSYMVPHYFIILDKIPLNHNGKLDRRALPKPDQRNIIIRTHNDDSTSFVTENEKLIINSWEEVLNLKGVHVITKNSNFIELGGNSLLMTKVLTAIKKFCPAITVADLINCETCAEIAIIVGQKMVCKSTVTPDEIVLMKHGETKGSTPIFIVHGGSGQVDWLIPIAKLTTKQDVYGIKLTQKAADIVLSNNKTTSGKDDMELLANYYVTQLQQVQAHGPYRLGGNSLGALVAFEMTTILEGMGEKVEDILTMDMPVCRFEKLTAYATASNRYEKAPLLLAQVWGDAFQKDKKKLEKDMILLESQLDEQIALIKNNTITEDAVFTKMKQTIEFLKKTSMPLEEIKGVTFGLSVCEHLFVDLRDRKINKINANVDVVIANDNRLMKHTLTSSGYEKMIDTYGWELVTNGNIKVSHVEGDHVDMVSKGKQSYAKIFDHLL